MKCYLLHLTIVARRKLSKLSLWAWPACLQGLLILQIKLKDTLSKHDVIMTSMDMLSARDSYVAFYNLCTATTSQNPQCFFFHKSEVCWHELLALGARAKQRE